MTKRWGPNLRSNLTRTKRAEAKKVRAVAKRKAKNDAVLARALAGETQETNDGSK